MGDGVSTHPVWPEVMRGFFRQRIPLLYAHKDAALYCTVREDVGVLSPALFLQARMGDDVLSEDLLPYFSHNMLDLLEDFPLLADCFVSREADGVVVRLMRDVLDDKDFFCAIARRWVSGACASPPRAVEVDLDALPEGGVRAVARIAPVDRFMGHLPTTSVLFPNPDGYFSTHFYDFKNVYMPAVLDRLPRSSLFAGFEMVAVGHLSYRVMYDEHEISDNI